MLRNWMALGLAALLVAAVGTAQGRPDPEKPKPTVQQQLDDIHLALQAINQNFERMGRDLRDNSVRGAQTAQDIRDLQDRMTALEQRLRSQQSMLRAAQGAVQDLRDLQDRLAGMEQRPALPDAGARRSLYLPPGQDLRSLEERVAAIEQRLSTDERRFSFTPEAPRRTGTLRLENRSAYGATVTVNGIPYRVPAFETRLVRNVPAGAFTYEVTADGFGVIRSAVTRTLSAGATFPLYINPGVPAPLAPVETVHFLGP